jgi:hypothetical protein
MTDDHQLLCEEDTRRTLLLRDRVLNGIDAVEVPWDDQLHPRVFFVRAPVPALAVEDIAIEGGVRVRDIQVVDRDTRPDEVGQEHLRLTVDQPGDFSIYTLVLDKPELIDPGFARKPFSFKAGCPTDLDCSAEVPCPPEPAERPVIDYLARDYQSFRQLLLDLTTGRVPGWLERHEADLGVVLVELLAYVADHLSYYQDAVANEIFLDTARQRESVRRHVKLLDYPMHEGASARTFVHLTVATAGLVPAGTAILTRIATPVEPGSTTPPGPVIAAADSGPALAAADAVFEVTRAARVRPALNELTIHTWGDVSCCLPRGATSVDLVGDLELARGQLLLLEEVRSPVTGLVEDADPRHRQVVRLTRVELVRDPLLTRRRGRLLHCTPGDPALPVTRVSWAPGDALTFPLCVSAVDQDGAVVGGVSVARGNLVPADHGRSVRECHTVLPLRTGSRLRQLRLEQGPMTFRATQPVLPGDRRDDTVAAGLELSPRGAEPQVTADVRTPTGSDRWGPVPDLLDSDPFAQEFVVEMGNDGRALLRFGDDEFGQALPDVEDGLEVEVAYRVGNGAAGNVGPEALSHVVVPDPPPARWPDVWPEVEGVRNPLPATGGVDPEPLPVVKRLAPPAIQAEMYRCVTEEDYARTAERLPGVARAAATFRWTGSWYTVFVALDPAGTDEVSPELERRARAFLTRFKQAGYDLEIDKPQYVPLQIEITVCVHPDYFVGDVRRALLDLLSNRVLPDGRLGLFHPDRLTFEQPVYLSALYAALESVQGVDSAEVVRFQRYGEEPADELDEARIDIGRLEIARLDNDPNAPENGVLVLTMLGGK